MKRFITAAMAGVIGLGALAATVGTASADPWDHGGGPDWRYRHYHHDHGDNWGGVGAGLAAGTILGLGVGALAASPRYDEEVPPPRTVGWRDHVDYCLDRFRTYDPHTDTYIGADGYAHRCYGTY